MKAIQNDYRDSEPLQTQQNLLFDKEDKNQQKKDQDAERYTAMKQKVELLSKEEYANYLENFMLYVQENIFFKKLIETKGFDDKTIQIKRFRFLESNLIEDVPPVKI